MTPLVMMSLIRDIMNTKMSQLENFPTKIFAYPPARVRRTPWWCVAKAAAASYSVSLFLFSIIR